MFPLQDKINDIAERFEALKWRRERHRNIQQICMSHATALKVWKKDVATNNVVAQFRVFGLSSHDERIGRREVAQRNRNDLFTQMSNRAPAPRSKTGPRRLPSAPSTQRSTQGFSQGSSQGSSPSSPEAANKGGQGGHSDSRTPTVKSLSAGTASSIERGGKLALASGMGSTDYTWKDQVVKSPPSLYSYAVFELQNCPRCSRLLPRVLPPCDTFMRRFVNISADLPAWMAMSDGPFKGAEHVSAAVGAAEADQTEHAGPSGFDSTEQRPHPPSPSPAEGSFADPGLDDGHGNAGNDGNDDGNDDGNGDGTGGGTVSKVSSPAGIAVSLVDGPAATTALALPSAPRRSTCCFLMITVYQQADFLIVEAIDADAGVEYPPLVLEQEDLEHMFQNDPDILVGGRRTVDLRRKIVQSVRLVTRCGSRELALFALERARTLVRHNAHAIKIQTAWRGMRSRQRVHEHLARAAVHVGQARLMHARRRLRGLRRGRRHQAAALIQGLWRGWRQRIHLMPQQRGYVNEFRTDIPPFGQSVAGAPAPVYVRGQRLRNGRLYRATAWQRVTSYRVHLYDAVNSTYCRSQLCGVSVMALLRSHYRFCLHMLSRENLVRRLIQLIAVQKAATTMGGFQAERGVERWNTADFRAVGALADDGDGDGGGGGDGKNDSPDSDSGDNRSHDSTSHDSSDSDSDSDAESLTPSEAEQRHWLSTTCLGTTRVVLLPPPPALAGLGVDGKVRMARGSMRRSTVMEQGLLVEAGRIAAVEAAVNSDPLLVDEVPPSDPKLLAPGAYRIPGVDYELVAWPIEIREGPLGDGGKWHAAVVLEYAPRTKMHLIVYAEGERDWCDLHHVTFRVRTVVPPFAKEQDAARQDAWRKLLKEETERWDAEQATLAYGKPPKVRHLLLLEYSRHPRPPGMGASPYVSFACAASVRARVLFCFVWFCFVLLCLFLIVLLSPTYVLTYVPPMVTIPTGGCWHTPLRWPPLEKGNVRCAIRAPEHCRPIHAPEQRPRVTPPGRVGRAPRVTVTGIRGQFGGLAASGAAAGGV